MTLFLKQSTQVKVRVGPFMDATDAVSPETGVTLGSADQAELLKADGAETVDISGATWAAVTGADGWYDLTLTTSHTDTVGELVVVVQDTSLCRPVTVRAMVVEEAIYESLFGEGATALATSSIASGGAALSYPTDTDNTGGAIKSISFVGSQTGTYANTRALDGTVHQIDDTTNEIDIVYGASIGGGRTAAEVIFDGYLNSGNDTLKVLAYNFTDTSWEQVGTIPGENGSVNISEVFSLLAEHTGTGADLGKVYIRFQNTGQSNPTLYIDRLWIAAVSSSLSVGYQDGAVWIDTTLSNTNTENFVDGVADNPVSTIAAALTIATSVGLHRLRLAPGSSITLSADMSDYDIEGENYTLAFNGQTITGAKIVGATVSGTFVGSTAILEDCIINAITGPGITMRRCFFNDATVAPGFLGQIVPISISEPPS
jgi:hypothetical protein